MMPARLGLAVLAGLAAGLSACSPSAPAGGESAPAAARKAPGFYYDLGPATVDVSVYPEKQRANYKLFLSVCGTCHTPARALNAPYSDEDTWRRYERRMHVKMENKAILLSDEDHNRIIEFLIYDSKVRKVSQSEQFAAEQKKLKEMFDQAALPRR